MPVVAEGTAGRGLQALDVLIGCRPARKDILPRRPKVFGATRDIPTKDEAIVPR